MLSLLLALSCASWSALDQDGDGLSVLDGDCWDTTDGPTGSLTGADIYPGAPEDPYDGIDTDCAGDADFDADGDGYVPDAWAGQLTVGAEDQPLLPGGDCDDADPAIHPDATELCNLVDDDCDGTVDDQAQDAGTWYADADGDGYGDAAAPTTACALPDGHVADASDCDDGDSAVSPAAAEQCNGIDDDCDELVDEEGDEKIAWYPDGDGDGYAADDAAATLSCAAPDGDHVLVAGDCDDADEDVHPGATETCDGLDQDCDGEADEGAVGVTSWFPDADLDGFGQSDAEAILSCSPPADFGWASNAEDCDDTATDTWPGAEETCDERDQDCDGEVDEGATDRVAAWTDGDGDGYGDPETETLVCAPGADQVAVGEDCDDGDPAVNPAATEVCNEVDDDCDGAVDSDATDLSTVWTDSDGDGYGDPETEALVCTPGADQVAVGEDCDDTAEAVFPGAEERCNGIDDDCDGGIDLGALDAETVYSDLDGDGFGDPDSLEVVCVLESWHTDDATDCDDDDPAVFPGAEESCNGIDDDCDDTVDEEPVDGETVYSDLDGDGFGDPDSATVVCEAESWQVDDSADCDDADPAVHPDATEVCNGVDDDCDGEVDPTWYESDFAADPRADVQINGDAQWRDSMIRLTDKKDDEFGSAFLGATVPGDLWQVAFLARIWDADATGADGMTFAFLDEAVAPTWLTTTTGSDLGLAGATGWAIELDTYDSGGAYGDPDGEHVALVRADDMYTIAYEADPPDLDSGAWLAVVITYDDGEVDVVIDGSDVLSASIGGTPPEAWRLGFTAATGGAHEKHGIDDLWVGCP